MADADVTITAGSGTKIDTRTVGASTDEHRQVVVLGSPSTATDVAACTAANGVAVDVTRVSGNVTVVQGTATNLKVDASGVAVPITDNSGSLTVDQATAANLNATVVQATAASLNATVVQGTASNLKVEPNGSVAHDGVDSGNPQKMGMRATNSIDDATMVSSGDRTDMLADIDGIAIVKLGCPLADRIRERVANTDGASTAFANFGAVASTRNLLDQVTIFNDSTTNGFVDIRDGTGGAVLWTFPAPAKGGGHYALPPGAIASTANTALAFDVSAALTTVYISVSGFRSKAF